MSHARILVVYYSRSGNTRRVAQALASQLGADIEEIRDTKDRSGVLGFIIAGSDAARGRLTQLESLRNDPSMYDLVVVGTPVWSGSVSTPIRTYLVQNRARLRAVAFFCTYNRISYRTFRQMRSICEKEPVAVLELQQDSIMHREYSQRIREFARSISERGRS